MNADLLKTPMAIVGMACRLPGADGLDQYWALVRDGRSAIQQMPPDRLDHSLYFHPEKDHRGKTYSTIGGLVDDRPLRWELIPPELVPHGADPCHQILCDVATAACRHAGYDAQTLPRKNVGVYVGHSAGSPLGGELAFSALAGEVLDLLGDVESAAELGPDLQKRVAGQVVERLRSRRPVRNADGGPDVEASAAASVIARALQFSGPQMVIDAACASSLVALALGAAALQEGQIELAVVGGASFNKADSLILFSHAQSCSAVGTRPFDAAADGLVSAEGYVVVLVKTLDRALVDGNDIHAVIRGLGLSSDGRGRSLWAPRKEGQIEAMRRAYPAGIDPASVQYIEAHATSTQVGDATELQALAEFFGSVSLSRRIPIGSVKSNIGHTLETAGLAGLLKTVLAMKNGVIPATINVHEANREVSWEELPFELALESSPWPVLSPGTPRRAAVNAFGIGGLNVHVLLEQLDKGRLPFHPAVKSADSGRPLPARSSRVAAAAEDDAIAIIGRGVVLPGISSIADFRSILNQGASQISEAPAERWRLGQNWSHPALTGTAPRRGGYIRNYEYDWKRYKIPPKQIARANPLQFMLLDAARQALAEAGFDERPFDSTRTAVVVGNIFGGEFGNTLQIGLRLPEILRDLQESLTKEGVSANARAKLAAQFEKKLLDHWPALLDETGSFTSSTLASRISKTLNLMGGPRR